jgi:hypothetical protein
MNQNAPVASIFLDGAIETFRYNKNLADRAIAQVPDSQMHLALDENTNSVVVIMKHIAGNLLSRWTDFLTSDGEKPWRSRDEEFIDTFKQREELVRYWESGWNCLFASLDVLRPSDVSKKVTIRGESLSVPLAIQRSLSHCGYHVGQIVMIARIHCGKDWQTLTIPRGGSSQYNAEKWGQQQYRESSGQ